MSSEWRHCRVHDLIEAHYSGPSPTCDERNIRQKDEWGLLKTTAITWENGWDWRQHKVPPKGYWNQTQIEVRPDDILVTKAGPRHRVGVVAHVSRTPPRLMASGKMIGLRPRTDLVVPMVLAGTLSTSAPQRFLDQRTTGMAESQVNFANTTLLDTPVSLPPMPEQRRIADILGTVDDTIRRTEEVIAKLQKMKQGLLHDLMTRGIGDNEEVRDRPEEKPGQFRDSTVGRIPRDWAPLPLDALTTAPVCYGIVQAGPFYPGGSQVLTIRDLAGDYRKGLHRTQPAIDMQYARSRVRGGDLLLSIKGTIGRVGVVPRHFTGNISRDLARIRLGEKLTPQFVRHYVLSPLGQHRLAMAVVGTTRDEISIHVLKKFLLPVPSVHEQARITAALDALEEREAEEMANARKLRALRHGLMSDLLTGRVSVTIPP